MKTLLRKFIYLALGSSLVSTGFLSLGCVPLASKFWGSGGSSSVGGAVSSTYSKIAGTAQN